MKKTPGKSKAKAARVKVAAGMSAGSWLYGNIWFSIGLSKREALMLKTITGRIWKKGSTMQTSAYSARVLLQACLAHYDVIEPLLFRDVAYSNKEGFCTTDEYLQGAIVRQNALLAGPVEPAHGNSDSSEVAA